MDKVIVHSAILRKSITPSHHVVSTFCHHGDTIRFCPDSQLHTKMGPTTVGPSLISSPSISKSPGAMKHAGGPPPPVERAMVRKCEKLRDGQTARVCVPWEKNTLGCHLQATSIPRRQLSLCVVSTHHAPSGLDCISISIFCQSFPPLMTQCRSPLRR